MYQNMKACEGLGLELRWFPRFQVTTTCFSWSPPDVDLVANQFHNCINVK
jgi:hypothetical protein